MADERRRYYRIEDEVLVSMQLIEQTDIDDSLKIVEEVMVGIEGVRFE